ncbi:pilus assembly protein TadG-related protein [Streptomyces sp. HD]|uniref:pilus assembly protein TadG-related protein n=1 Tax=Streptomyces sp. HD TaxID=3020892 RepID=UPI00232CB843|nr:pilus assembly protein TadG-related protein [Streptomyces sp. HD]MDC0773964.1 pilus assembly protein TadG-related protein [Streptomyces sp. HD]
MRPRKYGDAGQAFPIYITVVAGLLFLAFAYLAVGQAAATRNGAQTAADAAALAVAQDRRDQLAGKWLENVLNPDLWQDIFDGKVQGLDPSCWRAHQLAADNDAHVVGGCPTEWYPELSYTVEVKTNEPVGDSIVPGTEETYATATAKAVIKPRCAFLLPDEDNGNNEDLPQLNCRDKNWEHLDPDDPLRDLPGPEDLFDVHLAD